MPDVYTLRVRRTKGRKVFPFDRVYLVRYDDRALIKELFRYALVLPVVGSLAYLLKQAVPETELFRPHDRDDAASVPAPYDEAQWEAFVENGQWIMVVPILTRYFVKEIQAHPRYLVAQDWASRRDASKAQKGTAYPKDSIPGMSYLQTPEKNIRPICAACPRFINHQAGECEIGQQICFDNLPMGSLDYFKEGLDAPEPEDSALDEEFQGLLDGTEVNP